MDLATADCVGCYLCLAAIASSRVFHQAETHMKPLGILLEYFWQWTLSGGPEDCCSNTNDCSSTASTIDLSAAQRRAFDFVQFCMRPSKQLCC